MLRMRHRATDSLAPFRRRARWRRWRSRVFAMAVVVLLLTLIGFLVAMSRTAAAATGDAPPAQVAALLTDAGTATITWTQTSTATGVILARLDPADTLTIIALRAWMPYEDPQQRTLVDDQQPVIGAAYYLIETTGVPFYDVLNHTVTHVVGVYGPYPLVDHAHDSRMTRPQDRMVPAMQAPPVGAAHPPGDVRITPLRDGARIAWTQYSAATGVALLGLEDTAQGRVITVVQWDADQQIGLHQVDDAARAGAYYLIEWWADLPNDAWAHLGDPVQVWGSYGPYRAPVAGPAASVVYLPFIAYEDTYGAPDSSRRDNAGYPAPHR